jgi:hypothetical protein
LYTSEQLANLETITREQAESQAWYFHRVGHITASNAFKVAHTKSSKALINTIMNYTNCDFETEAIKWGEDHKNQARKCFSSLLNSDHQNVEWCLSGLVVSKERSYIGGSPDGIVSCLCCGEGVLEIKCPFKYRNSWEGCENDKTFCLDKDGKIKYNMLIITRYSFKCM